MPVGGIVGGVIGLAGSVISSNSARSASRDQANAARDASQADIALARETRAANEALFAQYIQDENLARAYSDALYYGTSTYAPGAAGGGRYTDAELQQLYPQLWQQFQGLENDGIPGNAAAAAAGGFSGFVSNAMGAGALQRSGGATQTITRQQVLDMIAGTPLAQLANTDFAAREDLADETYAGALDLADGEYGDLRGVADENYAADTDLAERARTGRRGVATDNLTSRLRVEEDSYAAWLPMSQQAEQDAINLNFSRGGVTGLIGQTRAGVGETTQDAAMERNLLRLEGVRRAYDPYYDDVTDAENYYWGAQGDALGDRGSLYIDATAQRGNRRQRAFDTYSGTRAANYDTFAGDRLNSYADYIGYLNDQRARGGQARNNIAGGNSDYASLATAANNRASQAAQAAHARQGQINQQLYGDLADIAGGAYGAIFNRKPSTNKPGGSGSVWGSSVPGRGKYEANA